MPTLQERGKAGDEWEGKQRWRVRMDGQPSGIPPPKEAAQATQEAPAPGQDNAAGDSPREVLGPQARHPVADPDLARPLRGFHLQNPRPP